MVDQHPEQLARDKIDQKLLQAGWLVQDYRKVNLGAGLESQIKNFICDEKNLNVEAPPDRMNTPKRPGNIHAMSTTPT